MVVAVANVALITTIGDGINALRMEMANPLPANLSPAGWSDSETPPSTTSQTNYCAFGGVKYADHVAASNAACASVGRTAGYQNSCGSFLCWTGSVWVSGPAGVTVVPMCSPGYTQNGSTCTLTQPSAAMYPSDGKASYKPVNNVLTPNPRDPDNIGMPSGTITRRGTDTYNNPVVETISSNGTNGYKYSCDSESVNQTTSLPSVQSDQYTVNSSGQVTSSTSNTYNNTTLTTVNPTPSGT